MDESSAVDEDTTTFSEGGDPLQARHLQQQRSQSAMARIGGGDNDNRPLHYLTSVRSLQYLKREKKMQNFHQHQSERHRGVGGSFRKLLQRKPSLQETRISETTPLNPTSSLREQYQSQAKNNNNTNGSNNNNGNGSEFDKEEMPTTAEALYDIILGKGVITACLLAIPFALWAVTHNWSATSIFWLNFTVMIPLAAMLGDFTEEVALHTNEVTGGLINASFGNAVEVVVAIQALLANEIRVVQASMLGSIFSNLLLVLGCCFFFGGLKHKEQTFNSTVAAANMGLLALSSIALVLPTPFAEYYNLHDEHVLIVSRVAAIFLVFMYVQLLIFQLYTHAHIFDGQDAASNNSGGGGSEKEVELATMSLATSCAGLLAVTLLVCVFSHYLVDSIEGFTQASGVSRTFVGLIILPIIGNAVEHISAVVVAMKDKMDLSMGIAVGSCTQISLFVVPLTVLCGWAFDRDMTLNFPHFEVVLYILSVFTVSVVCANPKCNWLEGSLLMTTYALIAVGFWFENVADYDE